MIDLTILQSEIHETTKFLGYKITKNLTIKKLKEEIKELKKSKMQRNKMAPHVASNIQNDKQFKYYFEKYLKDTIHDELPDTTLVNMSLSHELGICFETDLMNKIRYNKLREKKN